MNNKEDKLPVLMFGTEQVCLLKFDSQVSQALSFKSMFSLETPRVPLLSIV